MSNWPKDADPLTLAIQHLNSTPYALTKDECVDVLRKLRDEQAAPFTSVEVGEVVHRDSSSGHPVASFYFSAKGYAVQPGDKLYKLSQQ